MEIVASYQINKNDGVIFKVVNGNLKEVFVKPSFNPYFFVRDYDLEKILDIYPDHVFKIKPTNYKNIYDEPVLKLIFPSQEVRAKVYNILQQHDIQTYFADEEFKDTWRWDDRHTVSEMNPVLIFDVEVDPRNLLMSGEGIRKASNRIICIGVRLVDIDKRAYYDKWICDKDEKKLLSEFLTWVRKSKGLVGFNIHSFDIPYLINRMKNLGLETDIFESYPTIDLRTSYAAFAKLKKGFGETIYLNLNDIGVKEFNMPKYSLNNIGDIALWFENGEWGKLEKYNMQDVELTYKLLFLVGIEKEKAIAKYTNVDYKQIHMRSKCIYALERKEALSRNIVLDTKGSWKYYEKNVQKKVDAYLLPYIKNCLSKLDTILPFRSKQYELKRQEYTRLINSEPTLRNFIKIIELYSELKRKKMKRTKEELSLKTILKYLGLEKVPKTVERRIKFFLNDEKYEGALVFKPLEGYSKFVLGFDYEGLYPSVVQSFNMGYDTAIFKDDEFDYYNMGFDHPYNKSEVLCFRKDIKSIYSQVTEEVKKQRKIHKALREKYQPGSVEYIKEDDRQDSLKVLANSMYGVLGGVSRYYNVDLAESITLTARACLEEAREVLSKLGYRLVYSDTDSVYIQGKGRTLGECVKEIEELGKKLNEELKKRLIEKYDLEPKYYTIYFAPRDILASAHFFKKKMYVALQVWKEGKFVNQIVAKGMLFVKYNTPELVKDIQKQICLNSIFRANEEDFIRNTVEYLMLMKEKLYKSELDDKLKITQYLSDSKKYKSKPPFLRAVEEAKAKGVYLGGVVDYVFLGNGKVSLLLKNKMPKLDAAAYDYYWKNRVFKVIEKTLGIEFMRKHPDLGLTDKAKYLSRSLEDYMELETGLFEDEVEKFVTN